MGEGIGELNSEGGISVVLECVISYPSSWDQSNNTDQYGIGPAICLAQVCPNVDAGAKRQMPSYTEDIFHVLNLPTGSTGTDASVWGSLGRIGLAICIFEEYFF